MLLLETQRANTAEPPPATRQPATDRPTDHNNVEHLTPLFGSISSFTLLQSGSNKDVKTNRTDLNRPRLHVQNETNHK